MSPRGRARKNGRAAAAHEHMSTLDFAHDNVCRELKNLLKVLLFIKLPLKKSELYGEDGWLFIECDGYKVLIEALLDAQERGAQPENGHGDVKCLEMEPVDKNVVAVSGATDAASSNPPDESENIKAEGGERAGVVIHDNHRPLSPPSPSTADNCLPPPVISPPQIRRRPCYGWIYAEDDEDYETIETIEFTPTLNPFKKTSLDDGCDEMEH